MKSSADKQAIVIYERKDGAHFEVRLEDNTIWLSQQQISNIFVVKKAAVSKHIKHILAEGELLRKGTVSKKETVQREGARTVTRSIEYYNLDMIIAIGYRVNSKRATQFRIWATRVLRDHIIKGYTLNEKRIRQAQDIKIKELEHTVALLQATLEKRQAA